MSNLVVKMMSGENLADSNPSKSFILVEAYGEVRCVRDRDDKPLIEIPLESGQVAMYHPEGNTYLLKNGKTIATFNYQLHSDVTVKAIDKIKSNCSNWHYYSANATMVLSASDLKTSDIKSKYVMILDSVLEQEDGVTLNKLGFKFKASVLNPDIKDKFHVYQNNNYEESNTL